MMKSPVLYVPSLSKIPRESTARVFVFENGIKGDGPLGFQADVFDYSPNRSEYTPLRRIVLVKWINVNDAILLKAADSILMAEQEGSVMLLETNTIVNMPFVVWENGRR